MRAFSALSFVALSVGLAACHCAPPPPAGPTEWDRVPLRAAAGTASFHAIAGTGPNDVWVVGEVGGGAGLPSGCAFHYDGQRWAEVALPAGTRALHAVAAAAPDDVWAAGAAGTVLHHDGHAWTRETVPADAQSLGFTSLAAFQGPGSVLLTAAERGRLLLRDATGFRWMPVAPMSVSAIDELWGASASDVWIPGGRAAHFDGSAWQSVTVGGGTLRAIGGTGPSDVWMLGGRGSSMSIYGWRAVGFHYDGQRWTETPMPEDTLFMYRVCAASPTEAVAVGDNGNALRWNGHAWRRSTTGFEPRGTSPFPNLRGVYCWPGHAFAVGDIGPMVLRLR